MKNENNPPTGTIVYLALAFIALLIGMKIGKLAYSYQPLIDGILALTNLSLIYLLLLRQVPNTSKLFDRHVRFPGDLKYILLTLVLYLIIYWSVREIFDALVYLWAFINSGV